MAVMTAGVHTRFAKTKMCKYELLGSCQYGSSCRYAHSKEELNPLPDLRNAKFCKTLVASGMGHNASCKYAHVLDELRSDENDSESEAVLPVAYVASVNDSKSSIDLWYDTALVAQYNALKAENARLNEQRIRLVQLELDLAAATLANSPCVHPDDFPVVAPKPIAPASFLAGSQDNYIMPDPAYLPTPVSLSLVLPASAPSQKEMQIAPFDWQSIVDGIPRKHSFDCSTTFATSRSTSFDANESDE